MLAGKPLLLLPVALRRASVMNAITLSVRVLTRTRRSSRHAKRRRKVLEQLPAIMLPRSKKLFSSASIAVVEE